MVMQQRPARMPTGPSPAMGAGMPNKMDQLRMGAERSLPSMPPPSRMPAGRGPTPPGGGISALMGRPSAPTPPPMGRGAPSAPRVMGNAPMGGGMMGGGEEGGAPQEQDLVVGIALTANEIAGGSPRRAIAMLDQAKEILMQNMGEEAAPEGGDRLAELLG